MASESVLQEENCIAREGCAVTGSVLQYTGCIVTEKA